MSINVPLCQSFIDEFRVLQNKLDADCSAYTCQQAKERVPYLFEGLKEQQPEFIDDDLWSYKQKCSDALDGIKEAGNEKIKKQVAQMRVVEAFKRTLSALTKRLEQMESGSPAKQSGVSALEKTPVDVSIRMTSNERSVTSSKPVHDFTNDPALAPAETKRLAAQIEASDTTDGGWKKKYDTVERHLGIVQTNETNLRTELSKLKAAHNELAAEKDREKRDALASLQKSQAEQQRLNIEHERLNLELVEMKRHPSITSDNPRDLRQHLQDALDSNRLPASMREFVAPLLLLTAALLTDSKGEETLDKDVISADTPNWKQPDKSVLDQLDQYVYRAPLAYGRLAAECEQGREGVPRPQIEPDDVLRVTALQAWAHRQLQTLAINVIHPANGAPFNAQWHRCGDADLVWVNDDPARHNTVAGVKRLGYVVDGRLLRPADVKRYVFAGPVPPTGNLSTGNPS